MKILVQLDISWDETEVNEYGLVVPDHFNIDKEREKWRTTTFKPPMIKNQYGTWPSKKYAKQKTVEFYDWLSSRYMKVKVESVDYY